MRFRRLHRWDLAPAEAIAFQRELAGRLDLRSPRPVGELRLVAGADVAVRGEAGGGRGRLRRARELVAAVVVLRLPGLETVEEATATAPADFPYVPGLLSFREAPAVLAACRRLNCRPDALLCDGQGLAHPRGLGLASHLGLWLGLPTVGAAKSILVGEHDEPARARGAWTPLRYRGKIVGAALRTRDGVKPVHVSPGDRIDLAGAIKLVLACGGGCRLPEPTRRAHQLAGRVSRAAR